MKAQKGQVRVITGNAAAAYGAMLCRPDVATSYPITPMSEVAEQLSSFHADGILDAEMVEVEGENSAMNVVAAASSFRGPLLVVAAEDDRQSVESARIIAKRHPGADDLEIYESGGHGTRLFGPRPQVKRRIVEFARKAVEPVAPTR